VILHGAGPDNGWAFTVNKPDLVDVYALDVDNSKKPTKYRFDGGWRDFERSQAKFRVKLFGPFSLPVTRPVLRSVHGPVFAAPKGVFAVSYGGQGDVKAAEQWFRMNKARDFDAWRAAMAIQGIPSFNVVYGDKTGTIAYFYNAAIPVRKAGPDWSTTLDGADPSLVWKGTRPFGAAPFVVNPPSGYVVNANNTPFEASAPEDSPKETDYPAELGVDLRQTNRGFRTQELYGADASITAEEFVGYKMDHMFSARSKLVAIVDALAHDETLAEDPETKEAVALLKSWDRSVDRENRGAALALRIGCHVYNCYAAEQPGDIVDPVAALKASVAEMRKTFGRIDPTWGEAMRLDRGDRSLSVDGGPDTLRAVYPDVPSRAGRWSAGGGDTYILYADWAPDGAVRIQTIHQFGSATLDRASPHYADQAPLFAEEQWKSPPLTLDATLAEATRDYRPGRE
jgi:penicillin amidase/acyl-homoserine-lactone acylase